MHYILIFTTEKSSFMLLFFGFLSSRNIKWYKTRQGLIYILIGAVLQWKGILMPPSSITMYVKPVSLLVCYNNSPPYSG